MYFGDRRAEVFDPSPTAQTAPLDVVVPGYRITIVDCVIAVIIAIAIVGILLYAKNDEQD